MVMNIFYKLIINQSILLLIVVESLLNNSTFELEFDNLKQHKSYIQKTSLTLNSICKEFLIGLDDFITVLDSKDGGINQHRTNQIGVHISRGSSVFEITFLVQSGLGGDSAR